MTGWPKMRYPEERRARLAEDLSWLVACASPTKRADAVALAVIGDELAALNRALARIADALDRVAPRDTGSVPW